MKKTEQKSGIIDKLLGHSKGYPGGLVDIVFTVALAALLIMIVSNSVYGAIAIVALAAMGAYLGKLTSKR